MMVARTAAIWPPRPQRLRTAHVARPDEYGPGTGESGPTVPVDVAASSLLDLAGKLAA